jgi:hypothetical protein
LPMTNILQVTVKWENENDLMRFLYWKTYSIEWIVFCIRLCPGQVSRIKVLFSFLKIYQ